MDDLKLLHGSVHQFCENRTNPQKCSTAVYAYEILAYTLM